MHIYPSTKTCVLAFLLGLAACSTKDQPPAGTTGRRVILTPAGNNTLGYYSDASFGSTDRTIWVAAITNSLTGALLVAHLDTAGQVVGSRTIDYPNPYNGRLALATLQDGSCVSVGQAEGSNVLGQSDSKALVFQLRKDGTTQWSQVIATTLGGGNDSFVTGDIVSLGMDVLLCGEYYKYPDSTKQRAFTRIANDGTTQPFVSYVLPPKTLLGARGPVMKPLPAGTGAVLLEQLDATTLQLLLLEADGHLRSLQQLKLAGFPTTQSIDYLDIAVAPTSGNLAILLASERQGQAQLIKLTAAGTVLSTTAYTLATKSYSRFGKMAMGLQDQVGWTTEDDKNLYYYVVDAQGKTLTGQQLAPTPGNVVILGAFGLVAIGSTSAYGFGSFAGPEPANAQSSSLNFLRIGSDGRAGCTLGDAPMLSAMPVAAAQVVTLALPPAGSLPNVTTTYNLLNNPAALTSSLSCQ